MEDIYKELALFVNKELFNNNDITYSEYLNTENSLLK